MKLRNSSKFKVDFGARLMTTLQLPTTTDVAKHYLYILNRSKQLAITETATQIKYIWLSASLPSIKRISIIQKLLRYQVQLDSLGKYAGKPIFKTKLQQHLKKT